MILTIVLLLVGLALIVFGADALVEGASSVARRFGLSEFVIGLTIVGMGTSAPEMVVSFIGAFQGNADIAIGNVVGSNIFNTLLILGLTALILPMAVTPSNKKRDIPVNIIVTALLVVLGLEKTFFGIGNDGLSRIDGAILMAVFILYMVMSFKGNHPDEEENPAPMKSIWLSLLMIVGGLAGLIIGGNLFVDNATAIAKALGVSDKFIAITILAGGTSMPELATCVVAAAKKKGQLALGNIIGSNVFNILLILGGSALINPLSFVGMNFVDLGVLLLSAIVLFTATFVGKKDKIDRLDGSIFLLIFAAYMAYLIHNL
ncbi:MAG: calcium/sodium antiporter [Bacteroidales bacterium]|nr:calcium/sodium antiporter [Bacteroidales bacterium]